MQTDLIHQAAKLMREQAAAYRQLNAACEQLSGALVRGTPGLIESLVRAGETELLRMRARLVQIMFTLSDFADERAQQSSPQSSEKPAAIPAEARAGFEEASSELLRAARDYQKTNSRAAALATGGSTFANACIEACGAQPVTYRAPYTRRGEAQRWA
ncbi:MAG: hypothetical protein ACRD68_04875 [Pyrinomonadaceae bacterium]